MARACSSAPNRFGNARPILEGAKLRRRERIVIAHARPRVAGRDAEVGEQQRDELAAHGRAAVGVNRELLRLDALLRAGLLDQALGQVGALLTATIQPTT